LVGHWSTLLSFRNKWLLTPGLPARAAVLVAALPLDQAPARAPPSKPKECYFNVQMAKHFTKDLRCCSDDGAEAKKQQARRCGAAE